MCISVLGDGQESPVEAGSLITNVAPVKHLRPFTDDFSDATALPGCLAAWLSTMSSDSRCYQRRGHTGVMDTGV